MTSGNAPAQHKRSSAGKKQPVERGPVPSGCPGAGDADADRHAAGVAGASPAKPQRSRSHGQGMKQDAHLCQRRFNFDHTAPVSWPIEHQKRGRVSQTSQGGARLLRFPLTPPGKPAEPLLALVLAEKTTAFFMVTRGRRRASSAH
jgi:hypothetical protein